MSGAYVIYGIARYVYFRSLVSSGGLYPTSRKLSSDWQGQPGPKEQPWFFWQESLRESISSSLR